MSKNRSTIKAQLYMLIAIAGTLGAGKGTVAQYLAKKHNFIYLSVRAFFAAEVVKEGKMANRAAITEIAKKIRAENGPLYPLEQLLGNSPKIKNMVIESIRTVPEAEYLQAHGDALWFVDADVGLRYKRITERGGEMDVMSFENFKTMDQAEMQNADQNLPNLAALKARATHIFDANGPREDLFLEVEKTLQTLGL